MDTHLIQKDNWHEVFSACLGKMTAVQTACSEIVVRGRDWNMDFDKGEISFGSDHYPMQFIGSEATPANTWLWGWENINQFDESLVAFANETRRRGGAWGLAPLTTPEFELTEHFNGHTLSIVACGISDKKLCYYRGPHQGGAALAAFSNLPDAVFTPVPQQKFIGLSMQCIQRFPVDHKIFIESFLSWNNTPYEWNGSNMTAHFTQDLQISFERVDSRLRISGMSGIKKP